MVLHGEFFGVTKFCLCFISFVSAWTISANHKLFFLPSRFYQWLQSFLSTVHRKSPVEAAKTAYSVYRLWKFDGFTGSVEQCALDLTKVSCLSTIELIRRADFSVWSIFFSVIV